MRVGGPVGMEERALVRCDADQLRRTVLVVGEIRIAHGKAVANAHSKRLTDEGTRGKGDEDTGRKGRREKEE